jgi:hypothetical protein
MPDDDATHQARAAHNDSPTEMAQDGEPERPPREVSVDMKMSARGEGDNTFNGSNTSDLSDSSIGSESDDGGSSEDYSGSSGGNTGDDTPTNGDRKQKARPKSNMGERKRKSSTSRASAARKRAEEELAITTMLEHVNHLQVVNKALKKDSVQLARFVTHITLSRYENKFYRQQSEQVVPNAMSQHQEDPMNTLRHLQEELVRVEMARQQVLHRLQLNRLRGSSSQPNEAPSGAVSAAAFLLPQVPAPRAEALAALRPAPVVEVAAPQVMIPENSLWILQQELVRVETALQQVQNSRLVRGSHDPDGVPSAVSAAAAFPVPPVLAPDAQAVAALPGAPVEVAAAPQVTMMEQKDHVNSLVKSLMLLQQDLVRVETARQQLLNRMRGE